MKHHTDQSWWNVKIVQSAWVSWHIVIFLIMAQRHVFLHPWRILHLEVKEAAIISACALTQQIAFAHAHFLFLFDATFYYGGSGHSTANKPNHVAFPTLLWSIDDYRRLDYICVTGKFPYDINEFSVADIITRFRILINKIREVICCFLWWLPAGLSKWNRVDCCVFYEGKPPSIALGHTLSDIIRLELLCKVVKGIC